VTGRNLVALVILWLLLVGLVVAPSAAKKLKAHTEAEKNLVLRVDGYILCKPPGIARGDSTDCLQLPSDVFLVVPLPPTDPSLNKRDPLHDA